MRFESFRFNISTGFIILGLIGSVIIGCSSEVNYSPPADNNEIAINHYSFGKIVVNSKTYENDIAILADGSVQDWMAQTNHAIQLTDVKALMTDPVNKLIIGIGFNDGCSVTDDVVKYALLSFTF